MRNIKDFIHFDKINNVVFGGAGFLGSHLIDQLIKNGENVLCIDDLSTGDLNNISHLLDRNEFIFLNHDIVNPIISSILIEKIWLLACPASPEIYQEDPLKTIKVNYEGTLNILNLAKVHNSKMLFTSTSEVYGLTEINPQFENMPINLSTFSPRACYSEGKRIAETLISTFSKINQLDIRIARVFNTYGPRLNINDGRVIGNFIKQCSTKNNITIYGDGSQTRSFCFVSDLIEGLINLMNSNYSYPLNLGNDQEISIVELANLIKSKINEKKIITFRDLPFDDPKCRKPSLEKAKKLLNWNPKINLSEGLNKTISFYLDKSKK